MYIYTALIFFPHREEREKKKKKNLSLSLSLFSTREKLEYAKYTTPFWYEMKSYTITDEEPGIQRILFQSFNS